MIDIYRHVEPSPPMVGQGTIEPVMENATGERVGQAPPKRKKRDAPKWMDFSYWFNVIDRNQKELKPKERVELAKWAMEFVALNVAKPKAPATKEDPAKLLADLEAHKAK